MFCLESLKTMNAIALQLANAGKEEREALFLFTDPRCLKEREALQCPTKSNTQKCNRNTMTQ